MATTSTDLTALAARAAKANAELLAAARKVVAHVLAPYRLTLDDLITASSVSTKEVPSSEDVASKPKATGRGRGKRKNKYVSGKNGWTGAGGIALWLRAEMDKGTNPDKFLVSGMSHSDSVLDYWKSKTKAKSKTKTKVKTTKK